MQALVRNFRGIADASIDIKPIALLCGLNGAGKTSMARAIAAAATGKAVPWDKVTKKDCAILLRHGTKTGRVALGDSENVTEVEWPKADVKSMGNPPQASLIAAGISDFFAMDKKDALAYMIDLLKAEPTVEDLSKYFMKEGFSPESSETTAKKIWVEIDKNSFEAALKQAKEKGSQLKGGWAAVTGEAWGDKKAPEWFPEGWDDSLLQEGPTLPVAIEEERKAMAAAIGRSAVNKAEYERLQGIAELLPEMEADLLAKNTASETANAEFNQVDEQLRKTPNPNAKKDYACPHCDGALHVAVAGSEFVLSKVETIDENTLKQARLDYASMTGNHARLKEEARGASNNLANAINAVNEAAAAVTRMGTMNEQLQEGDLDEATAINDRVAELERKKKRYDQYLEARKYATQVSANQVVIAALDENGIRKEKLAQCLDAFVSSFIDPLAADFGIAAVKIDGDLGFRMGKDTYQLLSASEQYRVQVVLQMAIAKLEGAGIVILDGADILDFKGRGSLMNMLVKAGIPAVVCMTLSDAKKAPDLAKAGVGCTYWVAAGTCKPAFAEEKRAA